MAGAYNELDLLVLDAAKRGDCAALREFLDEGGSANARSASGTPAVLPRVLSQRGRRRAEHVLNEALRATRAGENPSAT